MGLTFAVLVFFGLLLVWVVLPFVPGLIEIRRKTDAKPLPIVHDSDVDIRYPARRFRSFVKVPLSPILERCRREGRNDTGALEDGTGYLVLGKAGALDANLGAQSREGCRQALFSTRLLNLPAKSRFPHELYSEDTVEAGSDVVCRAILAEESIRLGERCTTLRWIHAGGSIRTAPGCRLLGRASADGAMRLASGCRFERLHAPRIEFGSPLPPGPPFAEGSSLQPSQVQNVVEVKAGRWLVKGALWLGARKIVSADLVATGRVEIGEGTRINGSIKSHKDMVLARGVVVTGSVVSGRSITIGEGCRIHGPIIAEETITIGASCLLGSPDSQTTVSAKKIIVSPGVVCHGTVWAHEEGVLSGLDRDAPFIEVPRPVTIAQEVPEPQPAGQLESSGASPVPERPSEVYPDPILREPGAAELVAGIVEDVPAPAPEADFEPVVVPEPPKPIRHHSLPLGATRSEGPLTVDSVSHFQAREWTADPSILRRLVSDRTAPVDPRALPGPSLEPEGSGLLLIVPRRNGRRGVVAVDPDKIETASTAGDTAPDSIRGAQPEVLKEDRDEG
jgi:hypothetical protein